MDGARERRGAGPLSSFLAGLQAGMMGVLGMLAWLGVSAAWQQRSFWTAENLMASLFYGNQAIHAGFAGRTLSGLSLYLLIYSLLGGLLGWLLRDLLSRMRVVLLCVLFALVWYYLSYRLLWKAVAPLVALLHVERATVLGHLVYGTLLGRYPVYLEKPPGPAAAVAPAAPVENESAAPVESEAAASVEYESAAPVENEAAASEAAPVEPPLEKPAE